MLMRAVLLCASLRETASLLRFPVPATSLRPSPCAFSQLRMCADEPTFDDILKGLLREAETSGSMETAVDSYLDRLDDTFVPELYARIEAAQSSDPAELERMGAPSAEQLVEAVTVLNSRSEDQYVRARDQLQTLLGAGEINQMDGQLKKMVRNNEINAGFFYVLLRNIEDAQAAGDEGGVRLLSHIHTLVQEELEAQAAPALALLHKLTRLEQPSIRDNVLRDSLAPQTSVPIPGGGESSPRTNTSPPTHRLQQTHRPQHIASNTSPRTHRLCHDEFAIPCRGGFPGGRSTIDSSDAFARASGELPLDTPVPSKVDPMDLAREIEAALDKVIALPLDRTAIEQTAEDIRAVAKQAHQVVAECYDAEKLTAFQDALTPVFARSLPDKYGPQASKAGE